MADTVHAEQAVLGAVLIDPNVLPDVQQYLPAETAFTDSWHRKVYGAVLRLAAAGTPVDEVALLQALGDDAQASRLSSLTDCVPTSCNATHYARIVADAAAQRDATEAMRRTALALKADDADVDAVLAEHARALDDLVQRRHRGDLVHAGDAARAAVEAIRERADAKIEIGTFTGIAAIDRITRGWRPGELAFILARPSTGKTALMLQAAAAAARAGTAALVFSLEMSRQALGERLVQHVGPVDTWRLSDWERQRNATLATADTAADRVAEWPFYIDDTPNRTLPDVRAIALQFVRRHGRAVIFVDYLQLLRLGQRAESMRVAVVELTRGLKQLAREAGAPVVVLSQLNRGADDEAEGSALLRHAKESGSIEEDADLCLALTKPKLSDELRRMHGAMADELVAVHVAKHRNGPTGKVVLRFDRAHQTFSDPKQREQAPAPVAAGDYEDGGGDDVPF